MPLRTAADFEKAPRIRTDGSQESPNVVSMAEAEKIQEAIDKKAAEAAAKGTTAEEPEFSAVKPAVKATKTKEEEESEPEVTPEDPLKDVTQETLEAVQAKMEKNEALTEDEQKIADAVAEAAAAAEPEPYKLPEGVDDVDVTIGGETKKLSALFDEMQKEGEVDISGLEYKQAKFLLDGYLAKKHQGAWQGNLTRKSQEVAEQRKKQQQTEAQFIRAKQLVVASLERLTKKLEAKQALAAEDLASIDIYDEATGKVDPKKLQHYNQVQQAQSDLAELTEDQKNLEQEAATIDTERLYAAFESYQEANPLFRTTKPIRQAIAEFEQAKSTGSLVDSDDTRKVRAFYRVLDYSIAQGIPLDMAANDLIEDGAFKGLKPVPGSEAPNNSQRQQPTGKTRAEIIKEIARKQAKARPSLDGKGSVRTRMSPGKKASTGSKMHAAAAQARGGGEQNPALEKLES